MSTDFDIVNIIIAAAVLFFVFLLPKLFVVGTKKKRPKGFQAPPPIRQKDRRLREERRTVYEVPLYDMPYQRPDKPDYGRGAAKKAGGRSAKKRRPAVESPMGEGGPAARVTVTYGPQPAPRARKLPVYSDNPVINGIVWAEILTRRSAGRRGLR